MASLTLAVRVVVACITFGNFAAVPNLRPATPINALLIRLTNPVCCNPMGLDNLRLAY